MINMSEARSSIFWLLVLKEALGLARPAESFGLPELAGASLELCNVERGADRRRVRLVLRQSTRKICIFTN